MTVRGQQVSARDSGQVALLILGFAVILGLLVTVVVDVSSLYLERRALVAAADAGALAAAQGIDEAAVYSSGGGVAETVPLDDQAVEQRLRDQVDAAGLTQRFADFRVESVTSDGQSVTVELSARVRLPFVNVVTGSASGIRIAASARAQTTVATP